MKNKFDKVLVIHCHTSGLNYGDDVTLNAQALSVALGVVDMTTLKITQSVSVNVKFDDSKYQWNKKLESIHGFSADSSQEGESLSDAALILGEFLYNNFGLKESIPVIGYNALGFHVPFLQKILASEDLNLQFDNRCVDLFSFMCMINCYTVKDMFATFEIETDVVFTSLETIKLYVKILKAFRSLMKLGLGHE